MVDVNVWWVYMASQNITSATVLMFGNKVVLHYKINYQKEETPTDSTVSVLVFCSSSRKHWSNDMITVLN